MLKGLKIYYPLFFIPVPIFFTATGIYKGSSIGEGAAFALPISVFVTILTFFFNKKYVSVLFNKKTILLSFILLYSVLIFLLKIIFSEGDLNPNLLFISTIPLLASFCIGYKLKLPLLKDGLTKITNRVVLVFLLFCIAHLLASFTSFGAVGAFANRGEDSVFGLFSIYQKFVYYPTMLSCFFILSLFSTLKYKYIHSITFLLVVLMTGAREAFAICAFALLLFFFLSVNKISILFTLKLFVAFVIATALIMYFINPIKEILESATFLTKLQNLSESDDITAGRSGAIHEVFNNSMQDFNLLIGTGYSMNLGDFRSPHNQYAEVLLRSGIVGLGLFAVLVIGTIKKIFVNIKQHSHTATKYTIYGFAVVYLCLILISFNINVPVRAPYTAILFGFLSGFFYNTEITTPKSTLDRRP